MAGYARYPFSSLCCFVLFLLVNVAAGRGDAITDEGRPLGASCGSIDPCRAGVANDLCCKAINVAIAQGTCACACRQLKIYGQGQLAAACSRKPGCPKCRTCGCSKYSDGSDLSGM